MNSLLLLQNSNSYLQSLDLTCYKDEYPFLFKKYELPFISSTQSTTVSREYNIFIVTDFGSFRYTFCLARYNTEASYKSRVQPKKSKADGCVEVLQMRSDNSSVVICRKLDPILFVLQIEGICFSGQGSNYSITQKYSKSLFNNKSRVDYDSTLNDYFITYSKDKENVRLAILGQKPTIKMSVTITATDYYGKFDLLNYDTLNFLKIDNDPDLGDNVSTSHKSMYSSQGNDPNILLLTSIILFLHYMLTHAGMHAYNGNSTQVVIKNTGKAARNKRNRKRKQKNKNENNNKAIVVYKNKPIRHANNDRSRKIYQNNNLSGFSFSSATLRYLSLVKNPIHSMVCSKITDFDNTPSHSFSDYYIADYDMVVTGDYNSTTDAAGVFLYLTYGPTEASYKNNDLAWRIFTIPIDTSGRPIKDEDGSILTKESTNHDSIWSLCQATRMVAAGIRVNSLIDMSTSSETQYVAQFTAGQMKLGDFENWLTNAEINLSTLMSTTMCFWKYKNHEGASSRYDPFQQRFTQMNYYNKDFLVSNSDATSLNTHAMRFPYVFVAFAQNITPTTSLSSVSARAILEDKQLAGRATRMTSSPVLSRLSELSIDPIKLGKIKTLIEEKQDTGEEKKEEIETGHKISLDYTFDGKRYILDKNENNRLGATTLYYTFPIKLEVKYWLEGILEQPSAILGAPSPVDRNWDDVYYYMGNRANFPLVSNGSSFKGLINKTGKYLHKYAQPKYVNKASHWASGMAKSGRKAYADLSSAMY